MTTNVIDIEAWLRRPAKPTEPEDQAEYVVGGGSAVYKVREVAQLLSLSLSTTYELIRAGEIPATRLGGRWIIPKSRFHSWLDSCAEGAV